VISIKRRVAAAALVAGIVGVGFTTVVAEPLPAATTATDSTTTTTTTTTTPGTTVPADAKAPGLHLVTQPPYVATQGVEVLGLQLDDRAIASVPDAGVEITVHRSVTSRTDFDRAISGEELPGVRARLTYPFSTLGVNKTGGFGVSFGLSGSGAERAVAVDQAGVYPVEVGIVGAGDERATFVTWMVVVDPESARGAQPLRVAWIWPIVTAPVDRADQTENQTTLDEMHQGGRLDRIAVLLAHAKHVPLTLGIGPETLESWITQARTKPALRRGAIRVRRAARSDANQLLPEPYVPIEGPTIEAEGLGAQLPDEYVTGSNAIDAAIDEIPDPRTAFEDPIDQPTVDRLTQLLITRFVVRDTSLVPIDEPRTPSQPFLLTTSSSSTPSAATDRGLEQLLKSSGSPALRAQRMLAGFAEIAYETPSQTRGVVLAMPADWTPDLPTMQLLLDDLADNPLVKPVTLDDLFAEVSPEARDGAPLQRLLAPIATSGTRPLFASEYAAAVRALDAYSSMVPHDDPSIAAGQRALLLSLSTVNTRAESLAWLETIHANLRSLTSGITTTVKTLTLTARRARLPLSFQNDTKRAGIKVRVHLDSPKLIFPDGPDVMLELPIGHYTTSVPVEARASGTFSMTVTLESADGSVELGPPTSVTIRSAVFSGIGIALTIGALLFLAGWWGNHYRRSRRARRAPSLA
jgi:hypothetical protein